MTDKCPPGEAQIARRQEKKPTGVYGAVTVSEEAQRQEDSLEVQQCAGLKS